MKHMCSLTQRRAARRRVTDAALAAGVIGMLAAQPAAAFKIGGDTVSGSFDSTISFGFQKRMQGTDCSIIGNDNGGCVPTSGTLGELVNGPGLGFTSSPDVNYLQSDDGNLNYKKGDIVSTVIKGTHELYLKFPQRWSGLLRATWSKDFKADDTRRTPLSEDAKDLAVNNFTWLDAWLAKELDIGGRPVKVKVGNQVISWGEDIFIPGGVNAVNALDLRKFHTPGTQLKEVFRPAPMASFNAGVSDAVSLEGYYQWQWNGFRFDPAGTFFSSADVIGRGATNIYFSTSVVNNLFASFGFPPCGPAGTVGDPGGAHGLTDAQLGDPATNPCGIGTVVPRDGANRPRNRGQWGLALRYKPEAIDAEFALYHMRYHDKTPFISYRISGTPLNPVGLSYFEDYGTDKKLYGISMSTRLGDVAVGAELSYRPNDSVAIDPTVPLAGPFALTGPGAVQRGFVNEKKWQAHLTGLYLMRPSDPLGRIMSALGASEGFILAEAAVTHYPKLDLSGTVPYWLPDYELPTKTSWGYVVEVGVTYPNVFGSGWNMTPQIDFAHDVRGTSPNTVPFVEGRKAATFSLNFDRQSKWKANLGYTGFWGGGGNNLLKDRDMLYGSISYSF
ncbi:MAG: DUF1302 domain-containing protein [Betaproteobacteria bacterium]|nr:DUF1302 domain-containing protein [Betaproteobacteria bacterium]